MTQAERLLAFLRAHPGSTTMELQFGLQPFVSNPRARISDLRAQGYEVICATRSDGRKGYRLLERAPVTTGVAQPLWGER